MILWLVYCVSLTLLFVCIALPFFMLKEKACDLIVGYNRLDPSERALFDEKKLSKSFALLLLVSGLIFAVAAPLCLMSSMFFWTAIVVFIVNLLLHLVGKNNIIRSCRKPEVSPAVFIEDN